MIVRVGPVRIRETVSRLLLLSSLSAVLTTVFPGLAEATEPSPSNTAIPSGAASNLLSGIELERVQHDTLVTLGSWSVLSVATGGLGLVLTADPFTRAIATQAVAWGVIDGGIAAWGALQPGNVTEPARRQEDLARLFGLNALLDVGYLALGAWLASSDRLDQRGHGTGVLVQGLFLLVLDGMRTWQLWPR